MAPADALAWHPTGAAWFAAILAGIEQANASIELEFYIWTPGRLAERLHAALARAAARGCRVRVLLDAFGSEGAGGAVHLLRAVGADVRWFNPRRLSRLTFRNHRKLVVLDARRAFVGGCNVADEYDGDGVASGWRDLGVCTQAADCVAALAASFERMWAMAAFAHLPAAAEMPQGARGPGWELFAAGAGRGGRRYRRRLHRDLGDAARIDVLAAYFVPTTRLRGLLARVARRGRVRVIVPADGDVPIAQHASAHALEALSGSAIEVWQYRPAMLHAKLVVADDVVYVGSANFDPRSLRINFDLMLRLEDRATAERARGIVDDVQGHCVPYAGGARGALARLRQRAAYAALAWLDPFIARRKLRLLS